MHDSGALVDIRNVTKFYGPTQVLFGVDLAVSRGEVVTILGRSGSGKTTLLRCINQLEDIDGGQIRVNGELVGFRDEQGQPAGRLPDKAIAAQRRHAGMVFQGFNLFPHLSVLENVAFGPRRVLHAPADLARAEALLLLDRVGLADKAHSRPRRLSGGQQQRVAIARALAMNPSVLLFDEPTSALDPELTGEVLEVIKSLSQEHMTMVIVTHEMSFARDVSDRIVMMDSGRIVEIAGASEFFSAPQHQRSKDFLAKVRA